MIGGGGGGGGGVGGMVRYAFREYAGQIFKQLRKHANVIDDDFISSLTTGGYSDLGVSGKSGDPLFFSPFLL